MPIGPTFREASAAADRWLDRICSAKLFLEQGEARAAYGSLLDAWWYCDYYGYNAVLGAASDDLAAVSDSVIRIHRRGAAYHYASAHDAVMKTGELVYLFIILRLRGSEGEGRESFVAQVLREQEDLLEWNAGELRVRLKRERAKVLQSGGIPASQIAPPAAPEETAICIPSLPPMAAHVLLFLARSHPRAVFQEDVAARLTDDQGKSLSVSRNTVYRHLRTLRRLELTHAHDGGGEGVTPRGMRVAQMMRK